MVVFEVECKIGHIGRGRPRLAHLFDIINDCGAMNDISPLESCDSGIADQRVLFPAPAMEMGDA